MLYGRKRNVVDLGIAAPGRAAENADFEFARQVVELGIGCKQVGDFKRDWRGVNDFVVCYAGQRTPGYISNYVTAGSLGGQADGVQRIYDFGE